MKNLSIFSLRRKLIFHDVFEQKDGEHILCICTCNRAPHEAFAIPLSGSSPPLLPYDYDTLPRRFISPGRPVVGRALMRGRDASRWNRFRLLSSGLNVSNDQFHPRSNFRERAVQLSRPAGHPIKGKLVSARARRD